MESRSVLPSTAGLLLLVLTVAPGAPAGARPGVIGSLETPSSFTLAGADFDRQGDGVVLWADVDGGRSLLEAHRGLEAVARWPLAGFVGKGLRRGPAGRLLLQGVAEEDALRIVRIEGGRLVPVWGSGSLARATGLDEALLSLSRDLAWWYGAELGPAVAHVVAGRVGSTEPALRWAVEVSAADPMLSTVVDVGASDHAVELALAAGGRAWRLSPESMQAVPLTPPAGCEEIVTVSAGRDGLWAHCTLGVHALYALDGEEAGGGLQPATVVDGAEVHALPDGTLISITRNRDAPGTFRRLGSDGRPTAGGTFPAALGERTHFAGDLLLVGLPAAGAGAARQRYRAVAWDDLLGGG